jgi:hypothetical protein
MEQEDTVLRGLSQAYEDKYEHTISLICGNIKLISFKLRVKHWLPEAGESRREGEMGRVWSTGSMLQLDRRKMC